MNKPAFITCPKRKPYRDPHLLKMAKGKPCLLQAPGVCNNNPETTVACHSNLSIHGKGMSHKAHDYFTVWGCSSCHAWLDQGMSPRAEKEEVFLHALGEQVKAWMAIIECEYEHVKNKVSALNAVNTLAGQMKPEWVR